MMTSTAVNPSPVGPAPQATVTVATTPVEDLLTQLVDTVTRRGFLTTEVWAPIIGIALTWLAAHAGLGGGGWPTYIAEASPIAAGALVSVLMTARKLAISRHLIAPVTDAATLG